MMEQQTEWETRAKYPPPSDVPDRCQSGDVASDGPLGRPLEGVRVRVMIDDRDAYESHTGADGKFKVCLAKERSVGLFGEGPYVERNARVRLVFEREGFEPGEMAFPFDTASGGPRRISILLVHLARAPGPAASARANE